MSKNKILVSMLIAGGLVTPMAHATDGYFAQGYGMKANGMAGAGIAFPQDSLAAATNPAGMVMVGDRVDLGLTLFRPDRGADITGNCLLGPGACASPPAAGTSMNGSYDGNNRSNFLIPEFGYNKMMNPNMSLGVSVYGNGGLNSAYGTSPFGTHVGINMTQLFIAPTWAMKVNEKNSIGVALNLVYQTFAATGLQGFGAPQPAGFGISGNPNALTDNGTDTSTGVGLRLGWTGEITPMVTLGATYQPKTSMSKFSKYAGLFANQGSFDIPASYGVGIAVKATPATTIAADIMAIQYGDVAAVGNTLSQLTASGIPLGGSNGPGFGWTNTQVLKLGVSQVISDTLTVRAGYSHNTQPIPTSQTLFNILAPGVIQDHLTLGATWNVTKKNEVTVAYMHAFENSVNGSGSIPGGFGGGEANIHMNENSLGVAYSWKY
jgi:long-chain fatty acid transport protein